MSFDITCVETCVEQPLNDDEVSLFAAEYLGRDGQEPSHVREWASYICPLCSVVETTPVDTDTFLRLQVSGVVPRVTQMPPEGNRPVLTPDQMIDMIIELHTNEPPAVPLLEQN